MAWPDDAQDRTVFESEFDPAGRPPSHRVVDAVASYYDTEPTALDSLYASIEPDALDALLDPSSRDRDRPVEVRFHYEDLTVSVDSDGTLHLEAGGH